MDRRRFLKYAGATAAILGASALGLTYLPQNPSTIARTTTTSALSTASSSTQPSRVASLRGRLFFDYNGNGVQDEEEPAVAGALVQLKDDTGTVIGETLTDSSGEYKLEDVTTGQYGLHIDVRHFSDKRFAYMCTSPKEFKPLTDDYDISLEEGGNTLNIGLMEGFLTLPFLSDAKQHIDRYYDWDPSTANYLWWNGERGTEKFQGGTINHPGTDYAMNTGTPVVSAAPGVVLNLQTSPSNCVFLSHGYGWSTSYDHLSKILVGAGQHVSRGEIIGESGATGVQTYPHLHFDLRFPDHRCIVDPYSPVFEITPQMSGYLSIVAYGKTAWVYAPPESNPNNGRGQFTKKDDPQYC